MDFASHASSCNWGPWRLDELELCEGDLAIAGVRIDGLQYAAYRRTLSIAENAIGPAIG
jgi:hypothetical protein